MEEKTEEKKPVTKKKLGAKQLSKLAMIFSAIWIAVLTIFKGLGVIKLEINDIIYSGLAITAVWCPTFVSVYFDKIKIMRESSK